MKFIIITAIMVFSLQTAFAQQSKVKNSLCMVEITDVSKTTSFGYMIGYMVQFKNNTKKTVDGITWKELYYNNAGDLLKTDTDSFNSTNLIDPIASGFTKTITRATRVKGASKIVFDITSVHFTDGTKCN